MTTLDDICTRARQWVVEDEAQIMRIGNKRAFLICALRQKHLERVWPFLQKIEPTLERRPRCSFGYGYAFSAALWPLLSELMQQIDAVLVNGTRVVVPEEDAVYLSGLFYLHALIDKQRDLKQWPGAHNGWEKVRVGKVEENAAAVLVERQLPGKRYLRAGLYKSRPVVKPCSVVIPCVAPVSPATQQERRCVENLAESLAGPRDQYGVRHSRDMPKHVPVENLMANDNGRLGKRERG